MEKEEYEAKIIELEKENATLMELLNRGNAGNSNTYNSIRAMIVEKVNNEVELPSNIENWDMRHKKEVIERNVMSDLKWNIRVRRISDFRFEHIEKAKEFLKNYVIDSVYRKEV